MISDALAEVVSHMEKDVYSTPTIFSKAEIGAVNPKMIAVYLYNVHYIVTHTPKHLALAEQVATKLGYLELAEFFRNKKGEEVGHDQWAVDDMERLAEKFDVLVPNQVTTDVENMMRSLEKLIETNPANYLGYIYFAEAFTVRIGGRWLKQLEEKCNIPSSYMSIVGNHVELDVEHVEEDIEAISRLSSLMTDEKNIVAALVPVLESFRQFTRGIAQ